MSKTWGVQLEHEFVNIATMSPGDWAMLREIQTDIEVMEKVTCKDKSLLMAFIAMLHIKTIAEDTKRSINDELH